MKDTFLYKSSFFPGVIDPTQSRYSPNKKYPKLSVVIPSYNQGEYLEETILSVINQNYPNLELIVIDGGSKDNSVDIIKYYDKDIAYWVSEKDEGQSDAINKGLQKSTGEWVAWLNSDDCYCEGALQYIFDELDISNYDFLFGNCFVGSTMDNAEEHRQAESSKTELKNILRFFYNASHIIPSQSVFIRKTVLDNVGYLNKELHYCMDLDWFARIYLYTDKRLYYHKTICFYRINDTTKTSNNFHKMAEEAMQIALDYMPNLSDVDKNDLLRLIDYYRAYLLCVSPNKTNVFKVIKIGIFFLPIAIKDVGFKILLKKTILNNGK